MIFARHHKFAFHNVNRSGNGFTLLEMLIVTAMAGILLALALPSLREYLHDSAIINATDEMVDALNHGRRTAINLNQHVVMCKSSNVDAAQPRRSRCGGNDPGSWQEGWLLYVASDINGAVQPYIPGKRKTSTRLLQHKPIRDDLISIISNQAGNGMIHFNEHGFLRNPSTVVLAVCDDRGELYGRSIEISRLGQPIVRNTSASNATYSCHPK